jgi:hypothetical protein
MFESPVDINLTGMSGRDFKGCLPNNVFNLCPHILKLEPLLLTFQILAHNFNYCAIMMFKLCQLSKLQALKNMWQMWRKKIVWTIMDSVQLENQLSFFTLPSGRDFQVEIQQVQTQVVQAAASS